MFSFVRQFGSMFLASTQEGTGGQGGSSGFTSQAWESDPRWGREHWRIRSEPIRWPNNQRVATVCAISFGLPDLIFPVPQGGGYTGTVARVHVQMYGPRQGVWRLLDLLDAHGVKASFEVNGICAARFPTAVQEIDRRGHEIVPQYWANNVFHDQQSVQQDRELIRRTLSTIADVTGKRASGWVAPELRLGERTLAILAEEEITWHACSLSDDLPYSIGVGGRKMVVLPHSIPQMEDLGIVIGNRRSPDVFVEFLKQEFTALYREGAKTPKMFNFSLHAEFGGKPFFATAIEEALSYQESYSDVWFTTRQQVADWWTRQGYG